MFDSSADWSAYICAVDQEKDEEIVDLDPQRTVTYLENGVPHCYMGHAECYDAHTAERLCDEVDFLQDLES